MQKMQKKCIQASKKEIKNPLGFFKPSTEKKMEQIKRFVTNYIILKPVEAIKK